MSSSNKTNGKGRVKSVFGYDVSSQVGLRLREVRKQRGLSAREVGESIGISPNTLLSYETGYRRITVDVLQLIADSYDVPLSIFLKYSEGVVPFTFLKNALNVVLELNPHSYATESNVKFLYFGTL